MKIQNYKIDQYCKDLLPETPAILLYGQDYGLISERSSIIINSFFKNTKNQHNSLNIIDIMKRCSMFSKLTEERAIMFEYSKAVK